MSNHDRPRAGKRPRPGAGALLLDGEALEGLRDEALDLPSLTLTGRQLDELELLLSGALAPLNGYLRATARKQAATERRLPNGAAWPWPLGLRVTRPAAADIAVRRSVALRHPEGMLLAVLHVSERVDDADGVWLAGKVEGAELPPHYVGDGASDTRPPRCTPAGLHERRSAGAALALFVRSVPAPAVLDAARAEAAALGAQLVVVLQGGANEAADLDAGVVGRALQAQVRALPPGEGPAVLAMVVPLPSDTRASGWESDALLQLHVAANYGLSHVAVGPWQAASHAADAELPEPGAALALCRAGAEAAGIGIVALPLCKAADGTPLGHATLMQHLASDDDLPVWLAGEQVASVLRGHQRPRSQAGIVVLFTGLSGSGKSTVANHFVALLEAHGPRRVTLLDGDVVRSHLSSELGFSREHRNINVLRIGYVASEVARHGGAAVCAPIAPYADIRAQMRAMAEPHGVFVEVHICTPIEVCEARDRKGLYARARAGELNGFTGIDDPYDAPEHPELRFDTAQMSAGDAARAVMAWLARGGWIAPG